MLPVHAHRNRGILTSLITSQLHGFQFRTGLNGKDFKGVFFSWAMHREAEHPSSTHARNKILDFDQCIWK